MAGRLRKDGDVLKLSLSGAPDFKEALQKAKLIPGRRYNPDDKTWEYPADAATAQRVVHALSPAVDATILGWLREASERIAEELTTRLPDDALLDWPRAGDLFPYQRAGVATLVQMRRALLADDMGLGKTIEAIAVVEEHRRDALEPDRPKLVVAPSSVLGAWAAEIGKWTGDPVTVVPGDRSPGRREKLLREFRGHNAWLVVNWEQVRAELYDAPCKSDRNRTCQYWRPKQPFFAEQQWLAVIADEAHRAKNRNAQQTRGLWEIDAPIKLALTGTPLMNSPDELWSILAWLRPDEYAEGSRTATTYWQWFDKYVDYFESQHGRVITGVKNPDALRFELANKMVRRDKSMLVKAGALPPKLPPKHVEVEMRPKQRALYEEAEHALWLEIEQAPDRDAAVSALAAGDLDRLALMIPNAGARITRLRQLATSPALLGGEDISATLDAAIEIIGDNPGKQFVVFAWFQGTAELVARRLRRRKISAEALTGATPSDERTEIVGRFQAGETQIVVPTIRAGGQGITLTAADTAIFVEQDYVPALNDQAEDRLHRHGQRNPVSVVVVRAARSVHTTSLVERLQLKEAIVGAVVGRRRYHEGEAA